MFRGLGLTSMLLATSVESVTAEPDMLRYAITQGGLLAVVLVLLWSYRRDFLRIQTKDDEKIALLMSLVSDNRVAMERNVEATERLSKAVDKLDDRRKAQRG